jgi:hypothetical protein
MNVQVVKDGKDQSDANPVDFCPMMGRICVFYFELAFLL